MGCRAYAGNDVKQGLDGFVRVAPPAWTGWRKPVWCHLFANHDPETGWHTGVAVFGHDDPHSSKPNVLNWDEFSREDQLKLLETIEPEKHLLFRVKP